LFIPALIITINDKKNHKNVNHNIEKFNKAKNYLATFYQLINGVLWAPGVLTNKILEFQKTVAIEQS
jgi:hypothetical protein